MKRLVSIVALSVLTLCACTGTKTASRPTAQERLMQDGKVLYELGRVEKAGKRFELLLAQTSDERLRTSAWYYRNRIEKGLSPEKSDPRAPEYFEP